MSQTERNEQVRQRLLVIRDEFRRRLDACPPRAHQAVFYSGTETSLVDFIAYLGKLNPAFAGARNLERLPAGQYLVSVMPELKSLFPADYNKRARFELPAGLAFSASINGFWRELSARYARACSGIVHVLVAHDRTRLHHKALTFWSQNKRPPGFLDELKVFGFVEFPILVGALSDNAGVTAVKLYVEPRAGHFELLTDSPLAIGPSRGSA